MTIEKLIKYCLQYLEQDSEVDIMNTDLDVLKEDDTFVGYIKNVEHTIYMGLTRYAAANVLMISEKEFPSNSNTVEMTETKQFIKKDANGEPILVNGNPLIVSVTKPLYHKIKEVYAEDNKGNVISNFDYYVIGKKVKLKSYNSNLRYYVLYYPTINELSFYMKEDDDNIYGIELNDLNVTDEMAINLKYLVYSELKTEENPDLANVNKNYFESYLSSLETTQVFYNQNELPNNQGTDYTVGEPSFSREWSDIYGD